MNNELQISESLPYRIRRKYVTLKSELMGLRILGFPVGHVIWLESGSSPPGFDGSQNRRAICGHTD
jgi:hypothetical protein